MLTRIYIDNYRSFVNFEYRPSKKQLLLGENGSGKSSMLEAIRDLKEFISGGANLFTQSTRTRWEDRPLQVFELDAVVDGKEFKYRLEIRFAMDTRQPAVNLESLKVSGVPVFELSAGQIRIFSNDNNQANALPFESARSCLQLAIGSNANVRRFVSWMEAVYCFHIDPYSGKMDESADREERQPDYEVENLAGWYRYLVQEHPVENISYLSALKEVLDGFSALRFSSEEDGARRLRADFTSPKRAQVSYSISELSEGQRCLIALYMVIHFLIVKGYTVFIDEPENYIALREIQPWLLTAEEAVENHGGQLILISHNPELLNQWAVEYGLRFFREGAGHVRTEKFVSDSTLSPAELIARGWENE